VVDLERLKRRLWAVLEDELGPAARAVQGAAKVAQTARKVVRGDKKSSLFDGAMDLLDLLGGDEPKGDEKIIDVDATVERTDEV